ncbi:MAG: hypothetical protein KDI63_09770 [Gammaproteobacteria bacterium]|nr:hypothetical protein [Gammaproteobacteria bacterium]
MSSWISRLWFKKTAGGRLEMRTSSKALLSLLPIVLAGLVYRLLIFIERTESGPETIIVLAYGVVVLVAMLTLLVIMISIIDYLRTFE